MTAGLPLKLVPTGKSLSIRKAVPLVKDKDYDVERAMEALKAAQEIQDWFERNELSLLDLLRCSELKLAR